MTTQISVETLSPITHNQIPVITTELLAHLYGTKIKNISDNFLNNTTRFVVGKHFFKIEKNELREFKNRPETIGLVGKNSPFPNPLDRTRRCPPRQDARNRSGLGGVRKTGGLLFQSDTTIANTPGSACRRHA